MQPDAIQIASVYFFQGKALVHGLGRTVRGAWIPEGPPQVLEGEAWEAVGAALLASLATSRPGLPDPEDWSQVMAPLLSASGARKWPDFLKGASCLGVERRGRDLRLVPTRNLGEAGGFEPLPAEGLAVDPPGAEALAQALPGALARCR